MRRIAGQGAKISASKNRDAGVNLGINTWHISAAPVNVKSVLIRAAKARIE